MRGLYSEKAFSTANSNVSAASVHRLINAARLGREVGPTCMLGLFIGKNNHFIFLMKISWTFVKKKSGIEQPFCQMRIMPDLMPPGRPQWHNMRLLHSFLMCSVSEE